MGVIRPNGHRAAGNLIFQEPHLSAALVSNVAMPKTLAIFSLLVVALPCAVAQGDANEWGQTVDGLRMSVALIPGSRTDSLVRVTLNYIGDKPLLLPSALISADRIAGYRLGLLVSAPDGQHRFHFDGLDVIAGRLDPLVIPLVPHASYTLELPFAEWRASESGRIWLQSLVQQHGQLWVEWDCADQGTPAIRSLPCPLYGYPNPNQITCWQGKLTSNRVTLPK